MSTEKFTPTSKEDIAENVKVCQIEFYYDGFTALPKMKLHKENTQVLDPLTIYANACLEVLETHHKEVHDKMNELSLVYDDVTGKIPNTIH